MNPNVLIADTVSVLSLLVSIWAVTVSRITARRTTEPILALRIVSPAYMARVELRNTGTVPANQISIDLLERKKRASAHLRVIDVLAVGECDVVVARDFPEELDKEFDENHLVDATTSLSRIQSAISGEAGNIPTPEDQMAFHLLTREGGQRIIVSCDVPDKRRQQRIYKVRHSGPEQSKLQRCSNFLVRYRAAYIRSRYRNNSVLRPVPEMPACLREMESGIDTQE